MWDKYSLFTDGPYSRTPPLWGLHQCGGSSAAGHAKIALVSLAYFVFIVLILFFKY